MLILKAFGMKNSLDEKFFFLVVLFIIFFF